MNKLTRFLVVLGVAVMLTVVTGCMRERDAMMQYNQARVHIYHGEYDMAIPLLKECINVSHEDPELHYWLGKCYEELNDLDNAIFYLELAIKFDPSHDPSQMALIRVLDKNGQKNRSVETARLYFSHKRAEAAYFMQTGSMLLTRKLEPQAILAFDAAVRVDPQNSEPYIRVADYYYMQGDNANGEAFLMKAFHVNPYYPGLSRRMGEKGLRVNLPTQTQEVITPPTPSGMELR